MTPIEKDGFTLYPRGLAKYRGEYLEQLTGQQAQILYMVAQADGDALQPREIVSSRDPANHLASQIAQLRKKLGAIPCPIRSKKGVGYYWDA